MEFTISKKEITRRKAAYVALAVNIFFGLLLSSQLLNIQLLPSLYLSFIVAFFLLGVISFRSLNILKKTIIRLSDQEIERCNGKISERFLLSEVESIKIKRRKNGVVREIYIFSKSHKHLFISAFEQDFEVLTSSLLDKIDKGIPIHENYEPLDFDHILFYPILGLTIGFCFVCFLKLIISVNQTILKYFGFAISGLACSLAVFFTSWKPISRRTANKNNAIDYIITIIMFGLGIYVFYMYANL